jgi:hypothetical protein
MTMLSAQNLNSLIDEFPGVTAVTMPRFSVGTALSAPTSGTAYARLIALPPGLTVNNLDWWMNTGSTTPTHSWMALLTPGGLVAAVTTDGLATQQAAATIYRSPLQAQFTTPPGAPSLWYMTLMLAATTPGTWAGGLSTTPTVTGPAGTLPMFATAGTGFTVPQAVGTQLTLTAASGNPSDFYAATA